MSKISRLKLYLITLSLVLTAAQSGLGADNCPRLLDEVSHVESKPSPLRKALAAPFRLINRVPAPSAAENEFQAQAYNYLKDRGGASKSFYEAALKLKNQRQLDTFKILVDRNRVRGLPPGQFPPYYYDIVSELSLPEHFIFFKKVIGLPDNLWQESVVWDVIHLKSAEAIQQRIVALDEAVEKSKDVRLALLAASITNPAEMEKEDRAIKSILEWSGFPEKQKSLYEGLHRRYKKNGNVRLLADQISNFDDVHWKDENFNVRITTIQRGNSLVINIPSIRHRNSYSNVKIEGLKQTFAKLIYAALLGSAKRRLADPSIVDIQFTGQNIVNRKLPLLLKDFGFYVQRSPFKNEYREHHLGTGWFLSYQFFDPQMPIATAQTLTMEWAEQKRINIDAETLSNLTISQYFMLKILTENTREQMRSPEALPMLKKLRTPSQYEALKAVAANWNLDRNAFWLAAQRIANAPESP